MTAMQTSRVINGAATDVRTWAAPTRRTRSTFDSRQFLLWVAIVVLLVAPLAGLLTSLATTR